MRMSEQVSAAGSWGSGQVRMAVDYSCPPQEWGVTEAGALLPVPTHHWWGAADRDRDHLAPPAATRAD